MATVRILRSPTAGNVPSSLVAGQIAINEADGKLFYRNGSGAVTQLATGGGGGTELFTYATTANFPGTGATTALYLSIASGRVYQWNGSVYSEVGPVGGGGSLSATVTIPATGDQNWESVKLLLRGDGLNDGTAFADSGPASKSIVRVGNTVTSTAQSKFGGSSIYFDGSDSALEVGTSFDADVAGFGTSNFTIEMWFRTASASRVSLVSAYKAVASATGFVIQLNKDDGGGPIAGSIGFGYGDSSLISTTGGKWSADTWHHLAIVRSGSTLSIYVDGVSQASTTNTTDISDGATLSIGGLKLSGYIQDYTGYLDDIRITRAARYTGTFTPPTATYATGIYTAAQTLPVVGTGSIGSGLPPTITGSLAVTGDDSYGSVSLLLNGDDLTDRSPAPKTVTAYGSAAATGTARFGTNSLSFSGSSSYLHVPGNSAFSLPGDFTIEAWVRLGTPSAFSGLYGAAIVSIYAGIAGNAGWQLRINGTSSGYDTVNVYTGATDLNWSYSFALNTWYHVAITRSGTNLRAFVNGSQIGSAVTNSDNMTPTVNNDLYVGRLNLSGYEMQLNGLIDDLRITKGVARLISTPSAALPTFASYTLANVALNIS